MKTTRVWSLVIGVGIVPAEWSAGRKTRIPRLAPTCLITSNVNRLVGFYEPIFALKATKSGQDYAEFFNGVG
jgi:hypothetical protein